MFDLMANLKKYVPYNSMEKEHIEEVLNFLSNNENCYDRTNLNGHITAGALVCDGNGNILLNHHKKSGMWFQFGGHSDKESDSLSVAKREIMEEAGITNFYTNGEIFDVAVMKIPFSEKKKEPAHKHYDINFLFIVNDKKYEISNESMEIKWVTIDEANKLINPNDYGMKRMIEKYKNKIKH